MMQNYQGGSNCCANNVEQVLLFENISGKELSETFNCVTMYKMCQEL